MYLWTQQNRLNFGGHLHLNPDLETFQRILEHCEVRHLAHISRKTELIFMKILQLMYL